MAIERRFRSTSAEATAALGEALGRVLPPNSVLALDGDLGAGKTCFVRGLARGLGTTDAVASPTYTLMQVSEGGRLPLYHFDAWMEGREKALFLDGGDEWLFAGGVAVVEWATRVADYLPAQRLEIELRHQSETERGIRLRVLGAAPALAEHLSALEAPPGLFEEDRNPETGVNRPSGDTLKDST